jgi:hypothetical protein
MEEARRRLMRREGMVLAWKTSFGAWVWSSARLTSHCDDDEKGWREGHDDGNNSDDRLQ